MDRDSVAKTFWQRVGLRQHELNLTAKKIQEETEMTTGKVYRLVESRSRNVLPDTFTICVLASILQTTTDYLLGFVESSGEISTKERKVIEKYRENKNLRNIIDNSLELLP